MADYTLSAKITGDASSFSKAIDQAKAKMQGISDTVKGAGESITGFGQKATVMGAGLTASITVPFGKAISMTSDFDSAMRKAGAIAGASAEDLDKMRASALQLGADTTLSASEVAVAMTEMAAKGFDASQTIAAMPGVIAAAEASGEDLALTADTVAGALNGFKLSADQSGRVADVLAMAANKTAAGVGDMGLSFKYAAPDAANLGISLEELAAATGIMTDAGLQGSQAGTTLRMALQRLVKPTDAGAELMENLGFSATDAEGKFKPLNQIVGDLNTSLDGMTAAQKTAAVSTIFGTETASGMAILMAEGQEGLKGLTSELENSAGASKKAADEMMAGIGGALEQLSGAVESTVLSLGSELTPIISNVATHLAEMIDKFNEMDGGTRKLIAFGSLGAAALGPLLILFGTMTMGVGGLVSAIGFLISPVGLVVTAMAGLGIAFGVVMAKSEEFRNGVVTVFQNIVATISPVLSQIGAVLKGVFAEAAPVIMEAVQNIGPTFMTIFESIKSVIGAVIPVISSFVSSIVSGFGSANGSGSSFGVSMVGMLMGLNPVIRLIISAFANFGPQIASVFQTLASTITPLVSTIGTAIGQLASSVLPVLMQAFATLVPVVMQVGQAVLGIIQSVLPVLISLFNQLVPIIMQLVQVVAGILVQVMPLVSTLVSSLLPVVTTIVQVVMNFVSAIAPAVVAILQAIMAVIQAILPIIMSVLTVVVQVVSNIIATINPIIAFVGLVISQIMGHITPIITFIAGVITSIFSVITPIIVFVTGVFNTVYTVVSGIWQKIMTFISGIINGISGVISTLTNVVSGVMNSISGTVSRVMSGVSATISGVFSAIQGAWTGLTVFVSGVFDSVASAVQALVSEVKGFVNGVIGGVNAAVGIINKIPGVSIGSIPYLQSGTRSFQGGFARMNEGGRGEMVLLPSGAQVIPHDASMEYARKSAKLNTQSYQEFESSGGSNYTNHFNIDELVIREESDVDKVAEQLLEKQKQADLDKGIRRI